MAFSSDAQSISKVSIDTIHWTCVCRRNDFDTCLFALASDLEAGIGVVVYPAVTFQNSPCIPYYDKSVTQVVAHLCVEELEE